MRLIEKAEREVARGNLWRAKEILQGSLPNVGFNIQLYEEYGKVLLKMGDLPEAGKFLFLSGVRKPEYEEAIEIFLRKYGNNERYDFIRMLPRQARFGTLSEYPDAVAQKLRSMGFDEVLRKKDGSTYISPETSSDIYLRVACITVVLVVVSLMILGIIKLKEFLF